MHTIILLQSASDAAIRMYRVLDSEVFSLDGFFSSAGMLICMHPTRGTEVETKVPFYLSCVRKYLFDKQLWLFESTCAQTCLHIAMGLEDIFRTELGFYLFNFIYLLV